MSRVKKSTLAPPNPTRTRAAPQISRSGDAALCAVTGMIDELFPGFGIPADARVAVVDLSGVTFMTSFGVRQWLRSMAAVPPSVTHMYLVRCPTIIVDQLNMILNFGGPAKIISLAAPFICSSCNATSKEVVDVLTEGEAIRQGQLLPRTCKKCNGALVFDDYVESYFACLKKYAATDVDPAAHALIANAANLTRTAVKAPVNPAAASVTAMPAADAPREGGRSLLPVIVVALVLIAVAAGVYLLVGPS